MVSHKCGNSDLTVYGVVPEKVHTNPMEGHGKFLEGGGLTSQNFRSKVGS